MSEEQSGWDTVAGGNTMSEAYSTNIRDALGGNYSAFASILEQVQKVAKTRTEYLSKLKEIEDFYLTDVIVNTIADDALAVSSVEGEILELSSQNKTINKLLKELQEVVDLDQVAADIVPELLLNGEYFLGFVDGDVVDDLAQNRYIAAYKKGLPSKYISTDRRTGNVVAEDPNEIVHFTYSNKRIRVSLKDTFGNKKQSKTIKEFPKVFRMGRPLFYGGMTAKMKELKLLEQLVPAAKLAQVAKGTIVGVSVPATMDAKEAFKAVQRYQNILNRKKGVNTSTGTMSAEDVSNVAGRTQVIPIFGDKGDLRQMDVRDDSKIDDLLQSIQDIREVILSSIGIPPSLIFSSDTNKGDLIRQHARYGRILRGVRKSVANGFTQLAYIWLASHGIKIVKKDDVQVRFYSRLPDIQELDSLELSSATASIAGDLQSFISDLSDNENIADKINYDSYEDWLRDITKFMFNGKSLIKDEEEATAGKKIAAEASIHESYERRVLTR